LLLLLLGQPLTGAKVAPSARIPGGFCGGFGRTRPTTAPATTNDILLPPFRQSVASKRGATTTSGRAATRGRLRAGARCG